MSEGDGNNSPGGSYSNTGPAHAAGPPAQPLPLASFISALQALSAVVLDPQTATAWLGRQTLAAVMAHPALLEQLARFGWNMQTKSYESQVDCQGLTAMVQKWKYHRHGQLGSGSYGIVYKATDMETGEPLAVKKLLAQDQHTNSLPASTLREISALRELSNHENIVKLHDVISTLHGTHVYLVLERLEQDLKQYLETQPAPSTHMVKSILQQLLAGVAYCHAQSILHRDLKPANVLLDPGTGQVKITDFGLARQFLPTPQAYTEKVVTPYYRAPELMLGKPKYTQAVDLWSIGCIMAEMLLGQPLFQGDCEVALVMHVFQTLGTPNEQVWPGVTELLKLDFLDGQPPQWAPRPVAEVLPALAGDRWGQDLLLGLLAYDPARRLSAAAALQHPWFTAGTGRGQQSRPSLLQHQH